MIEYGNLTPERVAAGCEQAMRACDDAIARIVGTPAAERTFANTFGALETAADRFVIRPERSHAVDFGLASGP